MTIARDPRAKHTANKTTELQGQTRVNRRVIQSITGPIKKKKKRLQKPCVPQVANLELQWVNYDCPRSGDRTDIIRVRKNSTLSLPFRCGRSTRDDEEKKGERKESRNINRCLHLLEDLNSKSLDGPDQRRKKEPPITQCWEHNQSG